MFVNFNILNQLGSPAINSNTFANRPAAGQTGRLFVSIDTAEIYRDTGTSWVLIADAGTSPTYGTFVTPEMYGAVGNGITDDSAAVQSAVNTLLPVLLRKQYLIGTTISMPAGSSMYGDGGSGQLKVTANISAVSITNENVYLSGISVIGTNSSLSPSPAQPLQRGVYLSGNPISKVLISNCGFINLEGAGIYGTYVSAAYNGAVQVNNCFSTGCTVGFYNAVRAEYFTYSNCSAYGNYYGFFLVAGNSSWHGGTLTANQYAIYMQAGINDHHSVIDGATINHNNAYSFYIDGSTYGHLITNCLIFYGDIYIKNANEIVFSDNWFGYITNITFDGCTLANFHNNEYPLTPTFTNLNASTFKFFNETFAGTIPSLVTQYQRLDTNLGIAKNPTVALDVLGKSLITTNESYTTGVARANFLDYNLSVSAGGSFSSPNAITALGASLDLSLAGNATIPSGARSGLDAYNSISFTGTGTLTHNQGTQIRAYSNVTAGWAFAGSATGTITHLAGLRALFPDNSGSAVTVTNNYALLLNDQTANTGTVTYTNRWGIYQEGSSDNNYFAGKMILGTTTVPTQRLYVNGSMFATSGIFGNSANDGVDVTNTYISLFSNGNNPQIWLGNSGSGGLFGHIKWNSASNYLFLGHTYGGVFNENILIKNDATVTIQPNAIINGTLRINNQTSGTAGGSSGLHLIVNCDGTNYKIALLNV